MNQNRRRRSTPRLVRGSGPDAAPLLRPRQSIVVGTRRFDRASVVWEGSRPSARAWSSGEGRMGRGVEYNARGVAGVAEAYAKPGIKNRAGSLSHQTPRQLAGRRLTAKGELRPTRRHVWLQRRARPTSAQIGRWVGLAGQVSPMRHRRIVFGIEGNSPFASVSM